MQILGNNFTYSKLSCFLTNIILAVLYTCSSDAGRSNYIIALKDYEHLREWCCLNTLLLIMCLHIFQTAPITFTWLNSMALIISGEGWGTRGGRIFHKRLFRQGSHLSCCGQNEELAIQQFVIDHNYVLVRLEEQNEGKCLVKR